MRHALIRIYLNWKARCDGRGQRIRRFSLLGRRSKVLMSGATLALVSLLAFVHPSLAGSAVTNSMAYAATGGPIGDLFRVILASVILLFLYMMMIIDLLLVKLLIAIASYNDFVGAAAVVTGWPLVRDVANMFFIVVLLIIAFSTIIGYKEMDYKKYVPRLLLMAVLINFSKTLVGLLIDFSQVIMLTFVNGFKEAAFGNFVKMFGMSKILSIATSGTAEAIATTSNLVIAAAFGVLMMSIVGTIVLIMLLYFVARVIALWILLIFSPMAFFVWALPPKLQKSLSKFSGTWWSQLAAWLSGGPIVAFFLWLTMAIVAANDSPFKELMPSDSESDFLKAAITEAANPEDIARFIVASALLMYGLKTAVEVSKDASASLGKAAEAIKKGGGPIGYPARLGARAAGKAGAAGIKFADQKFGVTQSLGRGITNAGLAAEARGGALGSLVGGLGVKYGKQVEGISGARAAATAKEQSEILKTLTPEQRRVHIGSLKNSLVPDIAATGNRLELTDRFDPRIKANNIERYTAEYRAMGDSPEAAKAKAQHRERMETASLINQQRKDPALMANEEHKKFVDEKLKEDPSLYDDPQKVRDEVYKKKPTEITPEMRQNLDVVRAELEQQKFVQNGKLDARAARESDWYASAKKRGGNGFAQLEAGIATLERDPLLITKPSTGVRLVSQADGSVLRSDFDGANYRAASMGQSARAENLLTSAGMAPGDATAAAARFSSVSSTAQAGAVRNAYAAGAYSSGTPVATAATEMAKVQTAGVSTSQAFGVQNDGSYETPAFEAAHATAMSSAVTDIPANIRFIVSVDPQVILNGGPAAVNIASSMGANLDTVLTATGSDKALQAKLQPIIKAFADAGEQAETRIAAGVAEAADTALASARAKVMGNSVLREMAYPPEKKKKKK